MERRKFLEAAGLLVGSSVLDSKQRIDLIRENKTPHSALQQKQKTEHPLQPCLADTPLSVWTPRRPTITATKLDLLPFVKHEKAFAQPADFVIGLSESSINKLLVAHYANNPDFYDRSREKNPNSPVFEYDFDDHGSVRKIKFWAKVNQHDDEPAVTLELIAPSNAAVQKRFAAWWKCQHGPLAVSKDSNLPPNVHVLAQHIVLQLDFPKLDGGANCKVADPPPDCYHHVDLALSLSIFAYLTLDSAPDGTKELKLINWDIQSISNDDPLDPNDPIWGHLKPGCEDVEVPLRLALRDALVIATEILLANLSKNLVQALPLPPINVVQNLDLVPREIYVEGHSLAVTASLAPSRMASLLSARVELEFDTFENDLMLNGTDLNEVLSKAPTTDPAEFQTYMLKNVPAYSALQERKKKMQVRVRESANIKGVLPNNDFFVMLASNLIDQLAKALLVANKADCSPWFTIDVVAAYLRARACYWFNLSGAHGGITNTTISMGTDVRAGGGLDIQACVRNPCGPDQCATWSPGIGLKGPLTLDVHVDGFDWASNKALWISASFSKFPGLEVYGLPPGVDQVVNLVLNWVSSVAFELFANAVLSFLSFPLIAVPLRIPQANVKLLLHDFGAVNLDNMLVLTGTTDFS
jgi:hypothetical protein